MLTKSAPRFLKVSTEVDQRNTQKNIVERVRPLISTWQIVALVSLLAGLGSGWRVVATQTEFLSPLLAATTMTLATFAGWLVWGFFTHLADKVLFGGQADYQETLETFGQAYIFQGLFLFTFAGPLGWLWGWIAFYVTLTAWGIVGPRHFEMRSWQAMVTGTLGMLVWLDCLLVLTLVCVCDGMYVGIGAFLA